jgi:hypothetical protein
LVVGVVVGLIVLALRRAFYGRRLTMEQSVDRYRRTLDAVHEATQRSRADDGGPDGTTRYVPRRRSRRRTVAPGTRRSLAVAAMVAATVVVVAVVIAQSNDNQPPRRATAPTTTRPPTTRATTTTRPAPTTTIPLVTASGSSGTAFKISKPIYTLVVQATTSACWIDARDAAGTALYSGTLLAGQSQSIRAGTIRLQLGNPAAVTLKVEGTVVPFNLVGGSPLTVQLDGTPA